MQKDRRKQIIKKAGKEALQVVSAVCMAAFFI